MRFPKRKPTALDDAIARLMTEMTELETNSDEYHDRLKYLEQLHALKITEKKQGVSPDTVVHVLGSLAGILTIVMYEQKHVMTSKALPLLHRKKDT